MRGRLICVSRSGAVHHAHAARSSRTGRLVGGARRWTGTSSAHAVDGASNANTAGSLCCGTGRSCDGDKIALARVEAALDAITRRQEGVEALDEAWMAAEERRNSLDDARSIYGLALELKGERWNA